MRHVALLRGVNNIGMATRVSMADLRFLFEDLGFHEVQTVLNSGNIIFSARGTRRVGVRALIENGLARKLGFTSTVVVLSGSEVITAVRDNPLASVASDPSRLLVVVPKQARDRERLRPLLAKTWAPEMLAIGRRVAYVWCANGVGESQLWPAVDHSLSRSCTTRNFGTMKKLMVLVKGGAK
jgi:uncharacterized protein (DUF1697 family)